MPAGVATDVVALGDVGDGVLDETRLRGGPAHVEGDDVLVAERPAQLRRGDDPPDRTRFHHRDRHLLRPVRGHDAAVRLHDQEPTLESDRRQEPFQPLDIAPDLGPDVSVQHGRRGPFVFAVFSEDLVRQRAVRPSGLRLEDLPHPRLMGRIRPGVDEADRDRLDVRGRDPARHLLRAGFIERPQNGTACIEALSDLERQVARDVRFRPLEVDVVGLWAVAAPDPVDIAHPPGDDQCRAGAGPLNRRVDRDGRAVNEALGSAHIEPALAQTLANPEREIGRRRGALRLRDRPRGLVEGDEIREGPPDVQRDRQHDVFAVSPRAREMTASAPT